MDPIGWFYSLPPITRTWFGLSLAVNAAASLEFLEPEDLLFDESRLYPKLELWRIATSFLYGGGSLHEFFVLISLYMISIHSTNYENHPHHAGSDNPRADYVFCLFFNMTTIIGIYLLVEHAYAYLYPHEPYQPYLYPLFTNTLVGAITYLWAKRNANANVNFFVVDIPGRYLPFAQMALSIGMGNPVYGMLHGMLAGHIYYYFVEVVPRILGGRRIISTPTILVHLVNDIYGNQAEFRQLDQPQQQQQQQQQRARARVDPPPRQQPQQDDTQQFFEQDGANNAHVAAKLGQLERLAELSLTAEGRASFGAKDNNDWQPLHEAVRGGHLDCVDFLLGFGDSVVDINAKTSGGRGPNPLQLSLATHGPDHPMTRRLRELGAVETG